MNEKEPPEVMNEKEPPEAVMNEKEPPEAVMNEKEPPEVINLLVKAESFLKSGNTETSDFAETTDNIVEYLKRASPLSGDPQPEWIQRSVKFGIDIMFDEAWQRSLKQKAEKILQECEKICLKCVAFEVDQKVLSVFAADEWNQSSLLIWSSVIEKSPTISKYLGHDHLFPTFLDKLYNTLKHISVSKLPSSLQQQQLHATARLCLQVFQLLPKTIGHYVWDELARDRCTADIERILQAFVYLLVNKDSPRDLKLLIGMSISLLITMSPNGGESAEVFFKILKNIGVNEKVSLGNLTIGLQASTTVDEKNADIDVEFASISLINGLLLSSMNKVVLLHPLPGLPGVSFLSHVFPSVCQLARSRYLYNGFQLLLLWYQTFIKYGFCSEGQDQVQCSSTQNPGEGQDGISHGPSENCSGQGQSRSSLVIDDQNACSEIRKSTKDSLFSEHSALTTETLQLIWTNWDNPVKGVPEFVAKIFACLLKCSKIELKRSGCKSDGLLVLVKEKIMKTPWNLRGKHRLLTSLLECVDSQKLLAEYPEIPSELSRCLSTSFLASISSDVYRSFMERLKKEIGGKEEKRIIWCSTWMQDMITALTSNCQIQRYNASHFWVPHTLKVVPEILPSLQACLHDHLNDPLKAKQRPSYLFAWVAVMKTARNQNLLPSLEEEPLREVLYHCDDELRSDAFMLLCYSPKKSEPLSSLETRLLYECLPLNLNIDHAPFRQRLLFGVKSVLIRLRESSLAMLRDLDKKKKRNLKDDSLLENLNQNIDFMDWLWKLSIKSIFPGASYQRLVTVLDIIDVIFTTLTYSKQSARKAFTPVPESVTKLLKFATEQGKLDFCSPPNVKTLLCCTMEESTMIQEISCHLLLTYFPLPLHLDCCSDEATASHVLSHGLMMCRRPKGPQSASGANLCSFIFGSYAVNLNWTFTHLNQTIKSERPSKESTDRTCGAIKFIELLMEMVQESMKQAEADVLKASVCNPGHGYVQAIRLCIASHAKSVMEKSAEWKPCIEKVISIATSILNNVLFLLGGKSEHEGMAPSFAQMGTAILSMIQQTESGEEEEGVVLSDEFQHILTWCWISIKECSLLLGNLPGCLGSSGSNGVLDFQQIEHIGDMLMKILTNCRHRGAIEGCNLGFMKFMSSLLMSSDVEWNRLPGQYLKRILSGLTSGETLSSVTRRSAGLPLLIQSITTSETKLKLTKLFDEAMQTLLNIANKPYKESDQTIEIPQVNAMNIMETLFRDATLCHACLQYVSDAVILTVSSFSSPSWAIRSAALLLFGSLLMRMFGHKRMEKFSFSSTTTTEEFFSHYPDLQHFLLSQLEEVISCMQEQGRLLHPSVFPLLAILSRLAPSSHQGHDMADKFRTSVLTLLGNPVHQVRDLAAITTVVFIPEDEREDFLQDLVARLPENWLEQTEGGGTNLFHGKLLLIQKLIHVILQRNSLAPDIIESLHGKAWIAGPENPCFLLRSLFMQILDLLPPDGRKMIEHETDILDGITQPTHILVGKEQVQRGLSKHLLRAESAVTIGTFLKSGQHEVKEECLHCLHEMRNQRHGTEAFWAEVSENLFEMIVTETRDTLLNSCMELILNIHRDCSSNSSTRSQQIADRLKSVYSKEEVTDVSGLALAVSAIISTGENIEATSRRCDLEGWCQCALTYSQPTQTETTRLQAARAIVLGGVAVFCDIQVEGNVKCEISLFDACTLLLQDESSDVRQEITKLVSGLPHDGKVTNYQSYQFNSAMQILLRCVANHFSQSPAFLLHLFDKLANLPAVDELFQDEDSQRITSLFEQEDVNIFAEKALFYGLLCDTAKDMFEKCDHIPEVVVEQLKKLAMSLSENMKKATFYLELNLKGRPIFNALLNCKVYLMSTSFISLSKLLSSTLTQSSCGEECLRDLEQVTNTFLALVGSDMCCS
ncbi:tRNA (32-2'-O)-methyltransferase regulator THADA-like [Lineus longissimus]|uniref:tRNA (32-2'-O)-methyltransferase regulator THADA-like n=1 Tax=Lineus longissimus TaxID=88925 RepID=UPI002B4C5886